MTFLEGILDAGGLSKSMLASLVNAGLQNGLSGAAMLSSVREAGLKIRTTDFQQLVSEVRAVRAEGGAFANQPLESLPDPASIIDWQGGRPGSFLYRVHALTREGTGDFVTIGTKTFNITSSELMTGTDVVNAAQDLIDSGQAEGNYPTEQVYGFLIGGVYRQLGNA